MVTVQDFVKTYLQALQVEYDEEVQSQKDKLARWSMKQCQRLHLAYKLMIDSVTTGSQGRIYYQLQSSDKLCELRVGDVLALFSGSSKDEEEHHHHHNVSGVVIKVSNRDCTLAVKDYLRVHLGELHIFVKVANDVTFERMRQALRNLPIRRDCLIDLCFPSLADNDKITEGKVHMYSGPIKEDQLLNHKELNESQLQAVQAALDDRNPLVLIHGPPGTGKTHTLISIIRSLYKQSKRILVTAPSNLAVDNIVERLSISSSPSSDKVRCVRLGHPARLTERALVCSYDSLLRSRNDFEVVKDLRSQLDKVLRCLISDKNRKPTRDEYQKIKELRQDIKQREAKIAQEFLPSMPIVCCTCVGAQDRLLNNLSFDVIIIDESSQALEGECWIPILKGGSNSCRVILAGDHKQLPPTITSHQAERVLSVTLFERLAKIHPTLVKMLTVQYRMHTEIMQWSNQEFYGGKLIADPTVANWTLPGFPPITLIDTAGYEMYEDSMGNGEEQQQQQQDSKSNKHEVALALEHVKSVSKITKDIAIIVPYSAQVVLMMEALNNCDDNEIKSLLEKSYLEVGTVDGFQGREKDCIIVSLVRSNNEGNIGFLKELRRTNVAVTRARKHLCLIADTETIGRGDAAYKRLFDLIPSDCINYPDNPMSS